MFVPAPGTSMFDGWAEQYRRWRGIDRWPLVDATLIQRDVIRDDEGGTRYRLTIRYKPPVGVASGAYIVETLKVDDNTNLVYVSEGETIPIYCDPENSDRIYSKDLSQLTKNIGHAVILGGFILFFFLCWMFGGHLPGGSD